MTRNDVPPIPSQESPHRDAATGRFRNPWPGGVPRGFRELLKWTRERRKAGRARGFAPRAAGSGLRPSRGGTSAADAASWRRALRAGYDERLEDDTGIRSGSSPRAAPAARASASPPHAGAQSAPSTPRERSEHVPGARSATTPLVITWIGHSSFLIQIGGRNVLLDPMWSDRASPVQFAGPRRIVPPGIAFESLPPIDLVVESHDHYDHLDATTVRRIVREHPDAEWVAPRRVGKWLRRRGARVSAELDWWEHARVRDLDLTCTPAQHFSGRRLGNRDSTLWCGWVIRAGDRAIYFAGDTGRHPEFGAIARALGPFDAVLLPIGAYEPRWFMRPVHMDPEEAVAAYREIADTHGERAPLFVAMHWGTFVLTDEPVDEPPRLTREHWARAELPDERLWIPRHGETRRVAE